MRLIVIGEYGGKIPETGKKDFKEKEWQIIKAARNFWLHKRETVKKDLPDLKRKIENIIIQLDKK